MPSEPRNIPEQEHSIKTRAHELFVRQPEDGNRPTKPFPVYLRETPASPMSSTVKAMLWFAGIIVGILFLAAVSEVKHALRPEAARHVLLPQRRPRTSVSGCNES